VLIEINGEKIGALFKEWRKPLAIVLLAASLLFVNARDNAQTQAQLAAIANETHSALCTFKDDIAARLENTKTYLKAHPGPEPIEGITRADLKRSLDAQQRTLDALSILNCEES
jgi:hypothetical protein